MTWAFEHLRAVVRRDRSTGRDLAIEVAECLDAFDGDPAALVMAARRLLVQRPAEAPLWWVCARVLCAADPDEEIAAVQDLLLDDPTATRLAEALPFPAEGLVVVYGWSSVVPELVAIRPDLDLAIVRARGDRGVAARVREAGVPVRILDDVDAASFPVRQVLVEPALLGPDGALVAFGFRDAHALLDAPAWLVAPYGRVLPDGLAAAMARTVGDLWEHDLEPLPLTGFDRAVGPHGAGPVATIARAAACPVAPELLRLQR